MVLSASGYHRHLRTPARRGTSFRFQLPFLRAPVSKNTNASASGVVLSKIKNRYCIHLQLTASLSARAASRFSVRALSSARAISRSCLSVAMVSLRLRTSSTRSSRAVVTQRWTRPRITEYSSTFSSSTDSINFFRKESLWYSLYYDSRWPSGLYLAIFSKSSSVIRVFAFLKSSLLVSRSQIRVLSNRNR